MRRTGVFTCLFTAFAAGGYVWMKVVPKTTFLREHRSKEIDKLLHQG